MPKTTHVVKTRTAEKQPSTTTNLLIEWEGITPEQLQALAVKQIIIAAQAQWRRDATKEEAPVPIPATFELNAVDFATRGVIEQVTKDAVSRMIAALSDEDRKALMAEYAATQKGNRK